MKRVLMIIPNLDFGGAQNSFSRLSYLLQPYCSLLLVVFNKDNIAPITFGGDLVELKVPASSTMLAKVLNFIRRVRRLKRIKREFKPHSSISFLEGADYVNLLSSIGEEILFYIHGSKMHDRNITGWMRFLQKKILIPVLYSRADKILVVNERLQHELVLHFNLSNISFSVMPNFIDIQELRNNALGPVSDEFEVFARKHFTICISGRLAPEKGIDKFIFLLPELFENFSDLKILIMGDGHHKGEIFKTLKTLNISYKEIHDETTLAEENARVFFLGYQKNPYRFLGRSTLLALPSLNEGMPNTLVEAMCLGIPVVASDCPYGPRELLAPNFKAGNSWPEFAEFGVLVPVLNDDNEIRFTWITAISKLIRFEEQRRHYSEKGKIRCLDFSKELNLQRWKDLLRL